MLLSILTAARNAAETLPGCLESVRRQVLPAGVAVEHLVLDGDSTDGTSAVLRWETDPRRKRPAGPYRLRVYSEPDAGYYDALNKGLRLARGEVVGILDADHLLADDRALARVAEALSSMDRDACYGDLEFFAPDRSPFPTADRPGPTPPWPDTRPPWGAPAPESGRVVRVWRAGEYRRGAFRHGWMPPHPTLVVTRAVADRVGLYRTDHGTAADYEWMLRLFEVHRARPVYVRQVQVRMRLGGVSTRSSRGRLRAHLRDWQAWFRNGLIPFPWTLPAKVLRKVGQFRGRRAEG